MVDLLGNERHEGMQQLEQLLEELYGMAIHRGVHRLFETGLRPFQVPAAEIVPYQGVQCFQRFADTELGKELTERRGYLAQPVLEPLDGKLLRIVDGGQSAFPAFYEL